MEKQFRRIGLTPTPPGDVSVAADPRLTPWSLGDKRAVVVSFQPVRLIALGSPALILAPPRTNKLYATEHSDKRDNSSELLSTRNTSILQLQATPQDTMKNFQ